MTKFLPRHAFSMLCILAVFAMVSAVSYAYSGVFLIKVNGNLEQTAFNFYSLGSAKSMSKERLISLIVQKRTENGWKIAWRVQGESLVNSVSYGVVPNGMTQDGVVTKLSEGCKYRVVATSESAFGPNLYATSYFSFDKNGQAMPLPRIP